MPTTVEIEKPTTEGGMSVPTASTVETTPSSTSPSVPSNDEPEGYVLQDGEEWHCDESRGTIVVNSRGENFCDTSNVPETTPTVTESTNPPTNQAGENDPEGFEVIVIDEEISNPAQLITIDDPEDGDTIRLYNPDTNLFLDVPFQLAKEQILT